MTTRYCVVSGQNASNTMELGLTAWWLKDRAGRYPAQLPKSHLPSLEAVWKTYFPTFKVEECGRLVAERW
jgi:hypothetical protein